MKYINFHIKNFKGIKEVNINFEKNPSINIFTLVGLNESGKTTVLEAINLFSQKDPQDIHKFIPKSKKHNFNDSIEIEASIQLTDIDIENLRQFLVKNHNFNLLSDIIVFKIKKVHAFQNSKSINSDIEWTGELKVTPLKKNKERILSLNEADAENIRNYLNTQIPVIIYYPNFLFDIPEKIYLQENLPTSTPQKTKEEKSQPFFMQAIQDILDYMAEGLSIKTHIIERFKVKETSVADKEALEAQLLKMSSKMNQVIFAAWKEIFPKSKPKEIELNIAKDINDKSYFEITLREGSNKFQIAERSLGFRWFFTFLLFTEFRKVRSEDPGETIFLLDEPAYNLHSTAQKILLKVFAQLANKSKLIYTTHSHYLIDPTWLSGVYIIRNKAMDYENEVDFEESNTDVHVSSYREFVANHPDQTTYFQPILDALDYQPSKLENVPKLAIFEGKFDYYVMRYINEIVLNKKYNLYAYPGSGDDILRIIRLYLAWGNQFVVILDGDKAGNKAKQRYEKELGRVTNNIVFSLSDINAEWLGFATEKLFTEAERNKIVQEIHGKNTEYTKNKFNIAIESLLIEKKEIKLSGRTIQNFESIFKFINNSFKTG